MKKVLGVLAILSATVPSVWADITNGQFLPGSGPSPGSYTTVAAGGATIPGWTVTNGSSNAGGGGSVDWIGTYWAGINGNSIDLDGNNPGGITQTVTLPIGASLLNFYLAGNPDGSTPNSVTVGINNGPTTTTDTISNIAPGLNWQLEQLAFTSTGSTTVSFTSNDAATSGYGPVVSDVSVTEGLVNGLLLGTGNNTHPSSYEDISGGDKAALPGWTVTGNSVDLVGGYWNGPNGDNTVDLDGSAPGGLSQLVNFANGVYQLSFWLAANADGPPPTKVLTLSVGGKNFNFSYPLPNSTCTPTHSNMCGTQETVQFTANGPEAVGFNSNDLSSAYGGVVGNVSLTQVPEAGFYAYLGFALGLTSLVTALKRKRQAA